jgi:hypothetical protein
MAWVTPSKTCFEKDGGSGMDAVEMGNGDACDVA